MHKHISNNGHLNKYFDALVLLHTAMLSCMQELALNDYYIQTDQPPTNTTRWRSSLRDIHNHEVVYKYNSNPTIVPGSDNRAVVNGSYHITDFLFTLLAVPSYLAI